MPSLYYLCFLPPKTGGEWVNVQSVATLHAAGVSVVALVNPDAQFAGANFPVEVLLPNKVFVPDDVVVIPEYYREAFAHFATQPCLRVVHTQGPFLTFRGFDSIDEMNANGLLAGIACSQFTRNMMLDMGSSLSWQVVTPFVHPLFAPPTQPKKLQIAYMPDKRAKEAPVIRALFRQAYPQYADVAWVKIANVSRRMCAQVLAESAVFLSLSYLEGLGLPPLEAMRSDCVVCGFTGGGGSDYAHSDNGFWLNEADWAGCADAVAQALALVQQGGDALAQRLAAGQYTASLYNLARFEQELVSAWQTILQANWVKYLR